MEWLSSIRKAIDYIEKHLEEDIGVKDVADEVFLSPFFLQRGFSVMCGCSIGEYIRNRRLYESALKLKNTEDKVIDIACRYGYETPESFAKAFSRFHDATPSQVRDGAPVRMFLPLTISVQVQGGNQMDCKIVTLFPFKVIGFEGVFDNETSYARIPEFWDEICEKYANNIYAGNEPANPYEKAIMDNCIGEYAVCIDDLGNDSFRYLIAGRYTGGEVPEGMTLYEFPKGDWAIFDCIGPVPDSLQALNARIFREWLPGNPDYELCGNANVEWYDTIHGEMSDPDYHSAVWIPVRRKENSSQ